MKGYDYSRAGAYFVTCVCKDRECHFGEIADGKVQLSAAGRLVQSVWQNLPARLPFVGTDACVIMPNHVHGIILIGEPAVGAASSAPTLGEIVRVFKSISARQINGLLQRQGNPLWQRNYYEHIVRDERDLERCRRYIAYNPLRWALDREKPRATKRPLTRS